MTFTSICVVWYKYKLPLDKTDCTDNKLKILLFQPILIFVSLYFSVFGFIACAFGTYGVNCKFDCRCGGKECNSITGECFCDPGKTGPSCVDGKFCHTLCFSNFSAESKKGINTVQRCSIENQKGTIAVQSLVIVPF